MFKLQSLAALRCLRLNVWTSGPHITGELFTYNGQWCLCSVAPILAQALPTLHHVHITLSISGYPAQLRTHLANIDWSGLQRQLDRFVDLRTVNIEVRPRKGHNVLPESLHVVSSLAEHKLSSYVARGMLEVEVSTEVPTPRWRAR